MTAAKRPPRLVDATNASKKVTRSLIAHWERRLSAKNKFNSWYAVHSLHRGRLSYEPMIKSYHEMLPLSIFDEKWFDLGLTGMTTSLYRCARFCDFCDFPKNSYCIFIFLFFFWKRSYYSSIGGSYVALLLHIRVESLAFVLFNILSGFHGWITKKSLTLMEFYLLFYFKFAKCEVARMNGARFSMNFSMIIFCKGKEEKGDLWKMEMLEHLIHATTTWSIWWALIEGTLEKIWHDIHSYICIICQSVR